MSEDYNALKTLAWGLGQWNFDFGSPCCKVVNHNSCSDSDSNSAEDEMERDNGKEHSSSDDKVFFVLLVKVA